LHDGPQLRTAGSTEQRRRVATDGAEIEGEAGPLHAVILYGSSASGVERGRQRLEQVARDEPRLVRYELRRASVRDRSGRGCETRVEALREKRTHNAGEHVARARSREGRSAAVAHDDAVSGRGHDRVCPFEEDDRAKAVRSRLRGLEPVRVDPVGVDLEEA